MHHRRKLIEVALPLDAINQASAREKSIRHGHPSTLHLWWARRPLAAARAVIFAQMVDDPSEYTDVLLSDAVLKRAAEKEWNLKYKAWEQRAEMEDDPGTEPTVLEVIADQERQRLFRLIEQLVKWENTNNERVLDQARNEIWQSWRRACASNADHPQAEELFNRHVLPAFHDPFAGGGALPLEAQRLGMESWASDLNPVAVMINKAMIEIPPRFRDQPPVNPEARKAVGYDSSWKGADGLAEDVRYYGQWMRDRAEERIGHLYPKVRITPEMVLERPDLVKYLDQELTVIAWLWARTVKSPNPAFAQVDVPLVSTFLLSTKKGKEAYVEPIIKGSTYYFKVRIGRPSDMDKVNCGTKIGRGAHFSCLLSNTPIPSKHIYLSGKAGEMGSVLLAIVLEGERERVYIDPYIVGENDMPSLEPPWKPDQLLPNNPRWFSPPAYGLTTYADLFTPRQLVALTTFSDLVGEAMNQAKQDGLNAGLTDDGIPLREGGKGVTAYAEAVGVYLGFGVDKCSDYWSSICTWHSSKELIRNTFGRQAIPMAWDFVEVNPFCDSSGNWMAMNDWMRKSIQMLPVSSIGFSLQSDAQNQAVSKYKLVSTDPPYYDNIGYADLSDFFYVWMRRSLKDVYPDLFATLAVPKSEELVATPYRHGSKKKAESFFLDGMTDAMNRLSELGHPGFPVTIYYAFKQAETKGDKGTSSTGWETFLDAVIQAGFSIQGTWPMRTELSNRMIGSGTNALASSIVLVCRAFKGEPPTITRTDFLRELRQDLPRALRQLQSGNIAPVDLAQASIGPGMAVFTRYKQIIDAQGESMAVRDALALINQTLDEALAEQEGDFDADTRWALAWFEQFGFEPGEYGVAETLSKAKNTSVSGLVQAGILRSGQGSVRILRPEELAVDWDPASDDRLTIWEMVHHLIRVQLKGGDSAAAHLMGLLGVRTEAARELAYRLYNVCERKKWAAEALNYNALVQSWPDMAGMVKETPSQSRQGELFPD